MPCPHLFAVIEASPGEGLDDLASLLSTAGGSTGVAWLVALNEPPERGTPREALQERLSTMAVVEAADDMPVESERVYVAPAGSSIRFRGGRIHVQPTRAEALCRPAHQLFESLAAEVGPRTVGISLAQGGAEGLLALKAAGGLTVAKRPDGDRPSDPSFTANADVADLVLPVEEMARAVHRFASLAPDARSPSDDDDTDQLSAEVLMELSRTLRATTSLNLMAYKPGTVSRRVHRRMLLEGSADVGTYLRWLDNNQHEQLMLVRDLLINVTEFFRNGVAFDELRRRFVEPVMASADHGETIRCWVPGCSTGQEAYSIAMLLMEAVSTSGKRIGVQVFATDVDQAALRIARAGVYPPAIAELLPPERLERFFERMPGRGYHVRSALRDCVSFAVHDLTSDPPFSRMSLVSCRNLLIYLRREVQRTVLESMHFALVDDGILMLGASESSDAEDDLFTPFSKASRLYRRVPGPTSRWRPQFARPPLTLEPRPREEQSVRDSTIEVATPPSLLVSADDDIRFAHGDLAPYLTFPKGQQPRLEVMTSVTPELASKVRIVLFQCRRSGERASAETDGPGDLRTRIVARPAPKLGDGAAVLSFESLRSRPQGETEAAERDSDADVMAESLEDELRRTRSELRDTVEQLEASNEELRVSNEEAMSMNEELQSMNEELEATTEELRSVNEELTTVNQQLSQKIGEVERVNDDLSNFMSSANIPMVVLDATMCVSRFTPAAQRLLQLDHGDLGRHISQFQRDGFDATLEHDVAPALADLTMRSAEVRLPDGRHLVRRTWPYHTKTGTVNGVVITYADVTELKAVYEALQRNEERLRLAYEATRLGVTEYDFATGRIRCDARGRALLQLDDHADVAVNALTERIHPDDRQHLRTELERARSGVNDNVELTFRVLSSTGEERWVTSTGRVVLKDDRPTRLVSTLLDITQRKKDERNRILLSSIVERSEDAIVSKALDGTVLSWNRGAERMFGYQASELIGQPIFLVIPHERHDEERHLLERLRRGERIDHFETVRLTKDQRRIDISLTISPLIDAQGRIYGAAKIGRDITAQKAMARELAQREERSRLAAEAAALGTFDLDLQSQRLVRSPTLKAILGMSEGEATPYDPELLQTVAPEDRPIVRRALQRAFEAGGSGELEHEHRVVKPDGSRSWVFVKAKVYFSEGGTPERMVGAVMDITKRKVAEQRVVESEARMRRLFDQAPAMIAVFRGEERLCQYTNPLYRDASFTHCVVDESLTSSDGGFESQDYCARVARAFAEAETIVTKAHEVYDAAAEDYRYFHEVLKPWFGPEGEVEGVIAFAFDVTTEIELRQRLVEGEARFHALADNMAQLAWMTDRVGNIVWYNERWYAYTGTTFDEVRGWGWRKLHHPDHADRVVANIQRCFADGEPWEDTFPLRGADGRYRWFLSRALPIYDEEGELVCWFGTNTDVTEQRRLADKLRDSDRRKDEFIAMLGHELRNPLAAITTATELLGVTPSQEPIVAKASDVLGRQTAHMKRLVDGLLEVSRVSRGKIELEPAVFDLSRFLDELVSDRRPQSEKRGIELRSCIPETSIFVDGDRSRLTQVFDNLIHNAVKFSEAPGVVTVALETEGTWAEIRVEDEGLGIADSLLEVIFEPFQQARQELARHKGGLGLGLALAKALVEVHGGAITATSAGHMMGATFVVRLPLSETQREGEAVVATREPERPWRILLIEDNHDVADLTRHLLVAQGHLVTLAENGTAGLAALEQGPLDLVLCDIGLPGLSGYEVAERIRAEERFRDLPLVAVSGYGQPEDRRKSRNAGFTAHIVKPLSLDAIYSVMAELRKD